ncbi:MAG: prepilin-type N-terminal cleavage/methylation domain-containing protein [Candidatus Eisenbacteria bacterium]
MFRIRSPRNRRASAGFTLVELMVTLVILAAVLVTVTLIVLRFAQSKQSTASAMESEQAARAALEMIARDLRSAGYGADLDYTTPQPAIAYVDSSEIILAANFAPYPDTTAGPGLPLAYSPTANPRPYTLNGTAWAPPIRYRTGAELVRYTLDVNNDGAINASDLSASQGSDARRTKNPNDLVLVREVYGDSTSGAANNNGGSQERVALVSKPGAGVPPMFTVYMKGSSTPYDWANGPVPASQLSQIERVALRVTAVSAEPDKNGRYAKTTLTSQVNSMRSVPDFGVTTYTVDGYVFDDRNGDRSYNGTDQPLTGVTVRLGTAYVSYTSSTGYFSIRAPAGNYTLRHTPPTGFGATAPDSFAITLVSSAVTRSFADTARSGGYVNVNVYEDVDGDDTQDTGEGPLPSIGVTLAGVTGYTDAAGTVRLFSAPGSYSALVTVPDSMACTSTNPQTGTMTNGGSRSHLFGLKRSPNGKIRGRVFKDTNKNGSLDGGEAGLERAWVGATTDGGISIAGYAYTDANGDYEIVTPANDPPRTKPYSIYVVPVPGFYPTGSTSYNGIFVQASQILTGKNFGMGTFTVITLNASRVLSLSAVDLIEQDYSGGQSQYARADADLVLGADAGGTDNISVWFNEYANSPLFSASPTATRTSGYTRNAPNSVLSIAADTLDRSVPTARPDIVTGTKITAAGNLFVWFNQNSGSNEGYLPNAFSAGQNYRTNDNGDAQAVLTYDCAGGNSPDILVGTKSPTTGRGTFEVWQSNDAVTPTFTRQEIYPPAGGVPGSLMGEVTAMALADFDGDGLKDLVVGTKTGTYSGELMFFKYVSKVNGARFIWRNTVTLFGDAVTSLAITDVDQDGWQDVLVGTQRASNDGRVVYFRNRAGASLPWVFEKKQEYNAPGIVLSMHTADLGGSATTKDLIFGWRASDTVYSGGVSVLYLDLLGLPNNGVDPSAGSISNMVPAIASANFNYGLNTTIPPSPYLTDFAVGVKTSSTTGALVVFIR